ncbi:hypothetical protein [Coleofasciculus sp. E1-EBD-02]|uniref:hypothetical protein n=1 Tax=Coleofasciculus sp. E1-EBD-02 TaxID=3068481 RepID=UPI0032F9A933
MVRTGWAEHANLGNYSWARDSLQQICPLSLVKHPMPVLLNREETQIRASIGVQGLHWWKAEV